MFSKTVANAKSNRRSTLFTEDTIAELAELRKSRKSSILKSLPVIDHDDDVEFEDPTRDQS